MTILWDRSPTFRCHGCKAEGKGTIGRDSKNGECKSLPAGWSRGVDQTTEEIFYACSADCATKIEGGAGQ